MTPISRYPTHTRTIHARLSCKHRRVHSDYPHHRCSIQGNYCSYLLHTVSRNELLERELHRIRFDGDDDACVVLTCVGEALDDSAQIFQFLLALNRGARGSEIQPDTIQLSLHSASPNSILRNRCHKYRYHEMSRFSLLARQARQLSSLAGAIPCASTASKLNYYPLSSALSRKKPVLLLRGEADTIGHETTASVERVFDAAKVPISFREPNQDLTHELGVSDEISQIFASTGVALKGPYFTPVGAPRTSVNIELRRQLDLYANVVHAYSMPGVPTRHPNVDIVIIRENTEGEYSGLEHAAVPGVVESLKIITRERSLRIAEYAFQYAQANGRRKVTAVHKANIMKSADGLFLECCTEVAAKFPHIEFEAMIVDNTCMQMTSRPQQFDIMLLPNLYGNIVTNIATGLVGGPGLFPGVNIGASGAIFEQGARHSGKDIAGQNIANPTATILGSVLMLRYLKLEQYADKIENAVRNVYASSNMRTKDVVTDASHTTVTTKQFTNAVIDRL